VKCGTVPPPVVAQGIGTHPDFAAMTASMNTAMNAHAAALTASTLQKVKLKEVLSQAFAEDIQANVLSQTRIDIGYARYEMIYGDGAVSPENENPTREQYSAYVHMLSLGVFQFDFGVMGPYGNRILRQQRLQGLVPSAGGAWKRIELVGPRDFEHSRLLGRSSRTSSSSRTRLTSVSSWNSTVVASCATTTSSATSSGTCCTRRW
jgi:hypothetical protein